MTSFLPVLTFFVLLLFAPQRAAGITQNLNPTFTRGPDLNVPENMGDYSRTWATNIDDGNPTVKQGLRFVVTVDKSWLFSDLPKINDQGLLTFRPADDQFGAAEVTVYLKDDSDIDCIDKNVPCNCQPKDCSRSITHTFTINIEFVNQCPEFKDLGDVKVTEPGATGLTKIIQNWAYRVDANTPIQGANNKQELTQTLEWTLTNNNPSLFAQQPYMINDGDLKFEVNPYQWGEAAVTARVKDSGGIGNEGCDTSRVATFNIIVEFVNNNPFYTDGTNPVSVKEDAGSVIITNWATGMDPGYDKEDQQQLRFNVEWVNSQCAELFQTQPSLSPLGTLTFEPKPNVNTKTITCELYVQLEDDGLPGSTHGFSCSPISSCRKLQIVIDPVNDIPSFIPGENIIVWEDLKNENPTPTPPATFVLANWAKQITPGNDFEKNTEGQTVSFSVITPTNTLFKVNPTVDSTGSLRFTLNEYANGQVPVEVVIFDSEGKQGNSYTLSVTALASNNQPSMKMSLTSPVQVPQDCGSMSYSSFLTQVMPGPSGASDEATNQQISISLGGIQKPDLFQIQPKVALSGSSTGQLTFSCAPGVSGKTNVTVTLVDNGGTARKGVDTATLTFEIEIVPTSADPSFGITYNTITVMEGQCNQGCTYATQVTNIQTGTTDLTAKVAFTASATPSNLFSTPPAVSSGGVLTFSTAEHMNGEATVVLTGTTSTSGKTSKPSTFKIQVLPVNSAPYFKKSNDLTDTNVLTECLNTPSGCVHSFANWATDIRKGALGITNEDYQTLTFSTSIPTEYQKYFTTTGAVSVDPTSGNMILVLANNVGHTGGVSFPVTVTLRDNGGVEYGGTDSFTVTLLVAIKEAVTAPSFLLRSFSVYMDSGTTTESNFLTELKPGPSLTQSQTLSTVLALTVSVSQASLFENTPTTALDGTTTAGLTFTLKNSVFGSSTVTITCKNTVTGLETTRSATITVVEYNHQPSFSLQQTVFEVEQNSGLFSKTVATGMSAGVPAVERTQQTLAFSVSCDNTNLFSLQPTLSSSTGVLSFTPVDNINGVTMCSAVLKDNGGTITKTIPGRTPVPLSVDTSDSVFFSIKIKPILAAPSFTKGPNVVTYQGRGALSIYQWATRIQTGNPASPFLNGTNANINNYFVFAVTCKATPSTGGSNILFDVDPIIDVVTGTLVFTPTQAVFGSISCSVVLKNTDPSAIGTSIESSATQTFTINVQQVNALPILSLSSATLFFQASGSSSSAPSTTTTWASVSGMPTGATGTYSLQVTSSSPSNAENKLFKTTPTIADATGTLTVALADSNPGGTATVNVCVGVVGGSFIVRTGDPTSIANNVTICRTATFIVLVESSPPSLVLSATEVVVLENLGSSTLMSQSATLQTSVAVFFSSLSPGDTALRAGTSGAPASLLSLYVQCSSCTRPPSSTSIASSAFLQSSPTGRIISTKSPTTGYITFSADLLLTLKPNENGQCTQCVATVTDSAGEVGTSKPFTITVAPVNQAPSVTLSEFLLLGANAVPAVGSTYISRVRGVQGATVGKPSWLSQLTPGPSEESQLQKLYIDLEWSNSAACLAAGVSRLSDVFTSPPAVSITTGDLSFVVSSTSPAGCTLMEFSVVVRDDGGTANGGVDRTRQATLPNNGGTVPVTLAIEIVIVNKAPLFNKGPDPLVDQDSGVYSALSWATNIQNTNNQASSELSFIVEVGNPSLFIVLPSVSTATGTLTFTTAPGASGVTTAALSLKNKGGTENGGVDTSAPQTFTITIRPTPSRPSFLVASSTSGAPLQVLMNTNYQRGGDSELNLFKDASFFSSSSSSSSSSYQEPVVITNINYGTLQSLEPVAPAAFSLSNPQPRNFFSSFAVNNQTGKIDMLVLLPSLIGRYSCDVALTSKAGSSTVQQLQVEIIPVNTPPTLKTRVDAIVLPQGTSNKFYSFPSASTNTNINNGAAVISDVTPSANGEITFSQLIYDISPGEPSHEKNQQQTVSLSIACQDPRSVLKMPAALVNVGGGTADVQIALTQSPTSKFGVVVCTVTATDTGGTQYNGTATRTIDLLFNVTFINRPPVINVAQRYVDVSVGTALIWPHFASVISAGSEQEARDLNDTVVQYLIVPASSTTSSSGTQSQLLTTLFSVVPSILLSESQSQLQCTAAFTTGSILLNITGVDKFGDVSTTPIQVLFSVVKSLPSQIQLNADGTYTTTAVGSSSGGTAAAAATGGPLYYSTAYLSTNFQYFSQTYFRQRVAAAASHVVSTAVANGGEGTALALLAVSSSTTSSSSSSTSTTTTRLNMNTRNITFTESDVEIFAIRSGSVYVDFRFSKTFSQTVQDPAANRRVNDAALQAFSAAVAAESSSTGGSSSSNPQISSLKEDLSLQTVTTPAEVTPTPATTAAPSSSTTTWTVDWNDPWTIAVIILIALVLCAACVLCCVLLSRKKENENEEQADDHDGEEGEEPKKGAGKRDKTTTPSSSTANPQQPKKKAAVATTADRSLSPVDPPKNKKKSSSNQLPPTAQNRRRSSLVEDSGDDEDDTGNMEDGDNQQQPAYRRRMSPEERSRHLVRPAARYDPYADVYGPSPPPPPPQEPPHYYRGGSGQRPLPGPRGRGRGNPHSHHHQHHPQQYYSHPNDHRYYHSGSGGEYSYSYPAQPPADPYYFPVHGPPPPHHQAHQQYYYEDPYYDDGGQGLYPPPPQHHQHHQHRAAASSPHATLSRGSPYDYYSPSPSAAGKQLTTRRQALRRGGVDEHEDDDYGHYYDSSSPQQQQPIMSKRQLRKESQLV